MLRQTMNQGWRFLNSTWTLFWVLVVPVAYTELVAASSAMADPLRIVALKLSVAGIVVAVAMAGIMATLPVWVSDKIEGHSGAMDFDSFVGALLARAGTVCLGCGVLWTIGALSQSLAVPSWLGCLGVLIVVSLSVLALSVLAIGIATRIRTTLSAVLVASVWVFAALSLAHLGVHNLWNSDVEAFAGGMPAHLLEVLITQLWVDAHSVWIYWREVLGLLTWLSVAACGGLKLIRFA